MNKRTETGQPVISPFFWGEVKFEGSLRAGWPLMLLRQTGLEGLFFLAVELDPDCDTVTALTAAMAVGITQ